jgi:hypothetical protein
MTVAIYYILVAFCWGVLAATLIGTTVAISYNDMLSTIFFMGNALAIGYVLCRLKEG